MQGIFMGVKLLDSRDLKHKIASYSCVVISIADQPFCQRHKHTSFFFAIGFPHMGSKDQIYF